MTEHDDRPDVMAVTDHNTFFDAKLIWHQAQHDVNGNVVESISRVDLGSKELNEKVDKGEIKLTALFVIEYLNVLVAHGQN